MSDSKALLAQATAPLHPVGLEGVTPGGSPARYLIVQAGARDGEAVERLAVLLPGEPMKIERLNSDSQILELPERTFPLGLDNGPAAKQLGNEICEALDALLVEPDLPRAVVPVMPDRVPGLESVDNFPPGCWVPEEPDLEARPLWALDALRIRDAWKLSQSMGRPTMGAGIVIAQPDTGITGHVELSSIPQAGAFNTLGDGPANDAIDPLNTGFGLSPGHGTATGSVAVSRSRDAADRMVGTAPLASHMPIRALRSVWAHEELPIAKAIDLAVAKGAHVITMSLGGIALPFSPLHAAIKRAVANDVIVMAAAGNCVGIVVYPARFSECIAVAGTNQNDGKWPGSCAGSAVDISAPAQNVLRASVEPAPQGSIGQGQGTSFAVALLSGVAACWLAHHSRARLIAEAHQRGETLQVMFRRLVRATAKRPAGWDATTMGAGIADAEALLGASFDLGLGTESPAFELEERRPADEMRAFLTELAGGDPNLDDESLLRDGSEIAAALLALRLDPGTGPTLSPDIARRLTGILAEKLASALAAPPVYLVDTEAIAAQAEQAGRLRRALAFGKAAADTDSIEAASAATELPTESELSERLDNLLNAPAKRTAEEQADFEKAIDIIRRHGLGGVNKLNDPRAVVPPVEMAGLEAVVKADGSRPSLLIRENNVSLDDPFIGTWLSFLTAVRHEIDNLAALTGRIQPTRGHANRYCGTGTLVDPSGPWVLSNFHVVQQALQSYPVFSVPTTTGLRFTGGLEIDFVAETDSTDTNRWSIEEAVFPSQAGEGFGHIDAVLLRLGKSLEGKSLPAQEDWRKTKCIVFSGEQSFITGERPSLAVLGFPARPPQTARIVGGIDWGWVVGQLFGGRFGVKRLAPGEFYRGVGSHPGDAATRFAYGHDATTMKGSSGSFAFSLTDAACPAIGLHFAGYDSDSNFALTTEALSKGFAGRGVQFP